MEPSVGDCALQHHRPASHPSRQDGVPIRPNPGRRMAQYHLSGHLPISRSHGQKVVRSAAYAAGERLRDDRYGEEHDFSRKRHVLYDAMTVPENAPDWAHNRETFWNAVERKEKRKDSQLAIPYDIALPYELSLEQNIALLNEYVKTEFTDRGLVADIAIHKPDARRDQRNVHAHILIPTRPIDEDGLGPKPRNADSRKGWEQEREENIVRLRKSWSEHHNRHMTAAGFDDSHHIDHRSLEEQAIDRQPTKHRGVASDHMEERGIKTDRGDDYRDIKADNERRALRKRQRKDYAGPSEASPMPDAPSPQDKIAEEAVRKEQERQEQARKDQDKLQNELIAADEKLKELGKIYREAQQHRERLIKEAQELQEANAKWEYQQELRRREQQRQQNPYEEYAKQKEASVENRRQDLIDKRDRQYLEGDIRDPGTRYAEALQRHYDFGDPFQSLAKVAIAEHASFRAEQNTLSAEIAKTADPKAREALEIRRMIEGFDYLSMTGERIAVQSELITGRKNSEEAVKMRARNNVEIVKDEKGKEIAFPGYRQEADNLRFRYRELQAERQQAYGKDQQPTAPQPKPARERRPRGRGRDYDDLIKKQDDAAKAKEAERLANMTQAERDAQQKKERELQRERGRDR